MTFFSSFTPRNCRLFLSLALIAVVNQGLAFGQSPSAQDWLERLSRGTGREIIPEDSEMGVLADLRYPDPLWAGAIETCDRAFDALGRGEIPEKLLHPSVRTLIRLELVEALGGAPRSVSVRYGLPLRDSSRLSVPLRLSSQGIVNYGFLYLIYDENWYIEQWAVDISSLPAVGLN